MSQPDSAAASVTVALVHGAFADASSWTGVIQRLQAAGVHVTAPPNPLRGITVDSAYLASGRCQLVREQLTRMWQSGTRRTGQRVSHAQTLA